MARPSLCSICELTNAREIAQKCRIWRRNMEAQATENLSGTDRVVRVIVGVTLVGSTLVFDQTPAEIAAVCLLAAYPLLTALIGWGPITAIASGLMKYVRGSSAHTPKAV